MTIIGKIEGCTYTIEFHKDIKADIKTVSLAVQAALLTLSNDLSFFDDVVLWQAIQITNETAVAHKIKLVALMKEQ